MFSSRTSPGALNRSGFTLVELLVVITIIGILIGLLLPAVNAARESGRSAQCKNNLKQLGEACLGHEEAQGIFPTGGWGYSWVGDPDRGFGNQQPGGWIYNILPHTEMNALHDLGKTSPVVPQPNKQAAILQLAITPMPILSCPTRHRPAVAPTAASTSISNVTGLSLPTNTNVARTDYAINVGDFPFNQYGAGPANAALNGSGPGTPGQKAQDTYFGNPSHHKSPPPFATGATNVPPQSKPDMPWTRCRGISYEQSAVRKDDIRDGLSNTLLAGEKYIAPDCYTMGTPGSKWGGDSESMYSGMSADIGRTTSQSPMQDRSGALNVMTDVMGNSVVVAFGSAHPNAANFVLCDGSVITVSYAVDPGTTVSGQYTPGPFQLLGSRDGGIQADLSKL